MSYRWKPGLQLSNNNNLAPNELLLLGSLWYLGRGWTIEDTEEIIGISEEVYSKKITLLLSKEDLFYPVHVKIVWTTLLENNTRKK